MKVIGSGDVRPILSALMSPRLTPAGRRRLSEYRRKFEREPAKPLGITGGVIGSPIGLTAAKKMTDDQWLNAMAKYAPNANWQTFTGAPASVGAAEGANWPLTRRVCAADFLRLSFGG